MLHILSGCWGAITAVLTILVIYGNTLSLREDTELYLSRTEEMGAAGGNNVTGRANRVIVDNNLNSPTFDEFGDFEHRAFAGRFRFLNSK